MTTGVTTTPQRNREPETRSPADDVIDWFPARQTVTTAAALTAPTAVI